MKRAAAWIAILGVAASAPAGVRARESCQDAASASATQVAATSADSGQVAATSAGSIQVAATSADSGQVAATSAAPAQVSASSTASDALPGEFDERTIARILRLVRPASAPLDPTNRVADDPRAARLGQFLFFDKRLSRNRDLACVSCHDPELAFCDGKPLARGLGETRRNAPGLLDVGLARWLFWDGRADSLWSQALQPLENDLELGGSRTDLARLVATDGELRKAYEALFAPLPETFDEQRFPRGARPAQHPGLTSGASDARASAWDAMAPEDRALVERIAANVGKSIAAYERRLSSRGSPFDEFTAALKARDAQRLAAYPPAARRGLALFLGKANCRSCHGGALFSDQEFHNIGVADRGADGALLRETSDPGRYQGIELLLADPFNARGVHSDARAGEHARELDQLRQNAEAWGQHRTPSLRNVARTAPYMHQGQFATLREVLEFYSTLRGAVPAGHHGETVLRKLDLAPAEIDDLLAFLESLNDPPLAPELCRQPPTPALDASAESR